MKPLLLLIPFALLMLTIVISRANDGFQSETEGEAK